uniref:Chondroitin proteoglycan 4 domain-containing protein n=1 Tax=Ascaris lumbricoides TaxID=6252 RepID=A0A9J2P203_ASCLU
ARPQVGVSIAKATVRTASGDSQQCFVRSSTEQPHTYSELGGAFCGPLDSFVCVPLPTQSASAMILRVVVLHVTALLVYAQIPQQPAVATSSTCLNGCLQDGSLIFAASNLRNFEKIIINIEQFCSTYEQLVKCTASCSEADRDELARRAALSEYICKEKIEEFRLVRECIQSQDTETVNQCANECGHAAGATIQLDSSPSAAVNPFAFFDSISPICRTLECTVKCSIAESNKKCAGSGDIFRDIGAKQVLDANERLRNDLDNSSSPVAGQLAKIYLEALPEECAYIVDPVKYNTMFAEHEEELGSEMVTETASVEDFNMPTTTSPKSQPGDIWATVAVDDTISDRVSTRIVELEIETSGTQRPISPDRFLTEHVTTGSSVEATTTAFTFELVNEPEIPIGPPSFEPAKEDSSHEIVTAIAQPETPVQIQIQPVPNQSNVEHIPEVDEPNEPIANSMTPEFDQQWPSSTMPDIKAIESTTADATVVSTTQKVAEHMPTEEVHDVAMATSSNEAERTIMIVNDESEIANNEVRDEHHEAQQQKTNGAMKSTPVGFAFVALTLLFAF